MVAEIHALVAALDFAFVIADMLGEVIGRTAKIEARVDSKTLFDVVAKDGKTAERRLQIDVLDLKESYRRGELSKLEWIPGKTNVADALTKEALTERTPICNLMSSNRLERTSLGSAIVTPKERDDLLGEADVPKTGESSDEWN